MVSRRKFLRQSALLSLAVLTACGWANASRQEFPVEPPGTALPPTPLPPLPTTLPTPAPTRSEAITPISPTAAYAAPKPSAPSAIATRSVPPTASQAYLAVARGQDPAAITRAAIDALGGITRFVQRGDDVLIKPNICVAYHPPEFAATTNPEVVGALVALCLEAGARRVRVMDQPFGGTARQAYQVSGIQEAVERAGGQMELMSEMKFVETAFPAAARDLRTWKVYQDALDADVLINVPIAKHHSLARLTLAMKNLLGVVQNRSGMHRNLNQRLADLSTLVKPTLNFVDGVRVLMENGPTGGSLDYVRQANTIIASHDIVAADAYAAQEFFGLTPDEVGYIRLGAEMGLGLFDFGSLHIKQVTI